MSVEGTWDLAISTPVGKIKAVAELIEQVGAAVAEPARARNLVLTHLVPADNPLERWHLAQRGYSGRVTVAADLRAITVGSSAVDGG